MTKIKNTGAYPYKQNPVPNDFVTGSDSEDDGKTVSYKFQDILNLINSMNGNEVVSYIFTESPIGELDENGSGYFLSENNETYPSSITKIIVSKKIKSGVDLSDLFNFIEDNKNSFLLKLRNISDPNNFVYFEITNIVEDTYQFDFEINIYNANFFSGELIDKSTYTFDFDLAGGTALDVYSKIVYVNATSPTIATIFDTLNPPVTNDNSLKNDVNNLYIGNDASTWVYITSPAGYVTRSVTTTDTVPEGTINLYFKTARVLATLLTGVSFVTGGAIISTDSVLVAFGKIQKQINDNITAIGLKQNTLTDVIFGAFINGLTTKNPPIDTDSISIIDIEDSNKSKKLSFTNLKAFFKTYFDTLYQNKLIAGKNIVIDISNPINPVINSTLSKNYNNVIHFGNSICRHPITSIWWGDWGMAATIRNNDYVHKFLSFMKLTNINAVSDAFNISAWEVNYLTFDKTTMDPYLVGKDLVVLRLGENVTFYADFQNQYKILIQYIQSKAPNADIILGGQFFTNATKETAMQNVSVELGLPFVSIKHLDSATYKQTIGAIVQGDDGLPHAINDAGVASHPNDLGMQKIAEALFSAITFTTETGKTTPQKEVIGNTTLDNSFNGCIVKVKATANITVPATLKPCFNCVFDVYPTFTATFVAGSGVTLSTAGGLKLIPDKMGTLYKDGDAPTYRLKGETSV